MHKLLILHNIFQTLQDLLHSIAKVFISSFFMFLMVVWAAILFLLNIEIADTWQGQRVIK